ncbi:long-chain-fatty-acid--CoA ligase [Streptomyces lanatus]|uniref:Long-chain fatty acid--CoA ligase n=1 Tax=Streptomyces lanatus TaxID=66900 RepID=A0ABV1Y229_9ACTN|nr:long-chain fatty acid--CoA ligase [Streptomyces lanatus]GHH19771.1 AMP-dependent synthetase [Streptomyces lanatus]
MTLSVASVLAESAWRRPDHTALVHGAERVTYAELWLRARRYAAALRGRGVRAGDRVAVLVPNGLDFPAVYYGALALGAVVVPVNALLKAPEIEQVLRDCGARLLACAPSLHGTGGPAAGAAGVPLFEVGEAGVAGVEPIERLVPTRPDDIALVLYTSGTTGRAKGAMLTHFNVTMNIQTGMESPFAFRPDDVLLGCLPLFHTFGQICGMGTCFRAGATMVLMDRFEGAGALDLMVRHGCTVVMGVPTMYLALLDAARSDPRRPELNRAYSGGSALSVATLDEFEAVFGCPVYEGYGLTETSPCVSYNQPGMPRRPGKVGRPLWGVEVEIARQDLEGRIELLPAGEVGEVVIRGHNVMAGYLGRPEATAEVLVDGWFRSGDLGALDADGALTLVGRKKELVIRGGYNVYPREVEDVLAHHPAVAQAAVIGVPDARHGEEVCAVVRVREGYVASDRLAGEIREWGRERLAAYKYPRRIEFVTDFPLGPSGKILKRELLGRYAAAVR